MLVPQCQQKFCNVTAQQTKTNKPARPQLTELSLQLSGRMDVRQQYFCNIDVLSFTFLVASARDRMTSDLSVQEVAPRFRIEESAEKQEQKTKNSVQKVLTST